MMFNDTMNVPILLKVGISLLAIVVVNRITGKLLAAMTAGVLILAFWCGHHPFSLAEMAGKTLTSTDSLLLILVVFQVVWLSSQMKETGVMEELVESVLSRVSGRSAAAVLPAMIGLLPMPGGAWFSAPLVEKCDQENNVPTDMKTSVNYWFRHIWEYWWPLYPGVLVAIKETGMEIWQFIIIQLPMTLVMITTGYFIFLRKIPSVPRKSGEDKNNRDGLWKIIAFLSPVLITVGVYTAVKPGWILLGRFFEGLPEMHRYLPMICGLVLAQLFLQVKRPLSAAGWKNMLISKRTFMLVCVVAAVLVYGAIIKSPLPEGGTPVIRINEELTSLGFPLVSMIIALPFVAGISTGLAVGMVGASFPIVIGLLGENPGFWRVASTTILAYSAGYAGMILSPVHVCLLVTNKYFDTSLGKSLKRLVLPSMIFVAGATIIHLLYGML